MCFLGKEGKCPYTKVPENCPASNFEECQVDKDCSGDRKCCQNGCNRRCIGPRQGKSLSCHVRISPIIRSAYSLCILVTRKYLLIGSSLKPAHIPSPPFCVTKYCVLCIGITNYHICFPNAGCFKALEIAFLVDTSYSVSEEEMHRVKDFMKEIANGFSISETGARISIATFDKHAKILLKFKDNFNAKEILIKIHSLDKTRNGERRLDLGLEKVHSDVFSLEAGKRQVGLCIYFLHTMNVFIMLIYLFTFGVFLCVVFLFSLFLICLTHGESQQIGADLDYSLS